MHTGGFQSAAVILATSLVLASPAAHALPAAFRQAHAPSTVLAVAPPSPHLERGRALVKEGEFEDAIRVLQRGLAQPDLTDDQLVELYKLLGLAHLYLGDEQHAREAFEKLLQAQPDFEVSKSAPPKVRNLYARIKEDIKKRRVRPVTLTLEPVSRADPERPLLIVAQIQDLALGSKPKLYYRRAGAQAFSSVDFVRVRNGEDGQYRATVPAFELPRERQSYDVEFYVEVADAAQRRLAGRGDAFNPLTFRVPGESDVANGGTEDRAWYKSPWVWVGVGVVAAGATAGAIVLANQRQFGTVPVNISVKQ